MFYVLCPIFYVLCRMSYVLCPMSYVLCINKCICIKLYLLKHKYIPILTQFLSYKILRDWAILKNMDSRIVHSKLFQYPAWVAKASWKNGAVEVRQCVSTIGCQNALVSSCIFLVQANGRLLS